MGKVGVSATKYIIKARLEATGVVEKPDIIGAVFGQTEGLLGADLELRELQRSGRIGRIEVTVKTENGKTTGNIEIPTSLNKENTALIAAALETIERIGPCDAKITITAIDDVRASKRDYVVDRAKALLNELGKGVPESQELSEMVREKIRTGELKTYGADKLPGGPNLDIVQELILVEGRADVLNLLKHGITNIIAVGGTNVSKSLVPLCDGKTLTVFVDGDRGGDLILKALVQLVKITFVAKAPTGLEVEELTQKDLIKALRNKVLLAEALKRLETKSIRRTAAPPIRSRQYPPKKQALHPRGGAGPRKPVSIPRFKGKVEFKPEYKVLGKIAKSLMGSGKACLLKQSGANFREVGKVPKNDLSNVLANLQTGKVQALIIDWDLSQDLVNKAAAQGVKYVLGHRKPRFLKSKPGMVVLDIRDTLKQGGGTKIMHKLIRKKEVSK